MPQKTAILKSKYENKLDKDNDKNIPKKNYSNNLLKKCQMKYNSFIQEHRDVTMSGTKRYEDKSGEYYLQNLDNIQKNNLNLIQKSVTSLNINNNNNDNINNYNNYYSDKNINQVNKKKLNEELIPIPTVKQKNKIKNDYEKKNLFNAMGNAKYIRRYQYSNKISKKQIEQYKEMQKNEKIFFDKIKFIQIWWKTIYQIIKIQKYLRGYLFRNKLIQALDKREKYIDKVLNLSKCLKKIFLNKFLKALIRQRFNKKYYFQKWKEIIYKKLILKSVINNYSSSKSFKENYNNGSNIISKSNINIKNKKEEMDLEKEFDKFQNRNNENINNKSSLSVYKNNIKNIKNKKEKNISSSSFVLRTRKKNLNIGIEFYSSQIINRTQKKIKNEYELNNQTNYNKKNKKIIINNKRINIFENLKKKENKRNKSNNNKKLIKNINNTNTKMNLKEKSFNDLKSIKSNKNKNIKFFQSSTNKSNILTSSINSYNKNIRWSINSKDNFFSSKKEINKKKKHKYVISNLSNYSSHILNNKMKNKKKKVYENKLNDYNKKLNLEKNIEKDFLSLDKEQNLKEKNQPYIESIFDDSQFSVILDNSTLFNNKNIINYESENDKLNIENKKMRSNSCLDMNSLLYQETLNNNEKTEKLKKYFVKWLKKTVFGLLFKKKDLLKKISLGGSILRKKFIRIFINNLKIYNNFIVLGKFIKYLENLKFKLIINGIKYLGNKILLWKYFLFYKDIINKKIMIKKIVENQNKRKKKSKQIKRRNKKYLFFSDCELGNNCNFITDIPINNYNNNFINNNINLNNNTNNCYIINNLNYNNNNTNKINIGLTYETEFNKNNLIQDSNSINSIGIIRSKFIEFPNNIYKQKKIKNSIYKLDSDIINDDINNNNTIDNCNLFNYNINSNIIKNNNKSLFSHKNNLSKSVIISNNIDYVKPDIIAQKNQLLMVINIIEQHRKYQKKELFLPYFKKWKNILTASNPYTNLITNININNKNQNSFNSLKNKNEILMNCDRIITDYEDITNNIIESEEFPIESVPKSENKITTKSLKIVSKNIFNQKLNPKKSKGIYKKKTIGNSSSKGLNFTFRKSSKIKDNLFNEIPNLFQSNENRFPINKISSSYNIKQSNIEDNENDNIMKTLSDKNLITNNFDAKIEPYKENNDLGYNTPEKYFGFKKANKIEELEISFFPSTDNQIKIKKNDEKNKYVNSFNSISKHKKRGNEFDKINKKEIIIEAIEESNEYEIDKENIVKKIRNEFVKYEQTIIYRTFYHSKRNFNIELNKEEKENIKNFSMIYNIS